MVYSGDDEIVAAVAAHEHRIKNDALIVELARGTATQFTTEIEGHPFAIDIKKA